MMRPTKQAFPAILMFFFISTCAFGQTQDSVKAGTSSKPIIIDKTPVQPTTEQKPMRKLPTPNRSIPPKKINDVPDLPPSNARITYEYTDFDFGVVPAGAQVTHHFPVKNTGPDTLIISKIKAG